MPDLNSTNSMNTSLSIEIVPYLKIPDFLVGEVQAKLAYVDESILEALVGNELIELNVARPAADDMNKAVSDLHIVLEEKVQQVVNSMVKGAITPKTVILENYLDRPVMYDEDPMIYLMEQGEIVQEEVGIYSLGSLLSKLIEFFECQFV